MGLQSDTSLEQVFELPYCLNGNLKKSLVLLTMHNLYDKLLVPQPACQGDSNLYSNRILNLLKYPCVLMICEDTDLLHIGPDMDFWHLLCGNHSSV